jgi:3-phosphoshikimate 1-carboxyvinyltransferase
MLITASNRGQAVNGELHVPGDKSISHRALIFSSLAQGASTINGFLRADDTMATLAACRHLGVDITEDDQRLTISGRGRHGLQRPAAAIDLGNSGTAMRLLAGVLAAQEFDSTLVGDASLQSRPMDRIVTPLQLMGATVATAPGGCAPLSITGSANLNSIKYASQVASAQVKSCILLAGLCAGVAVTVTEPEKSRDHSERMLAAMGAALDIDGRSISLAADQNLSAIDMDIPGDPSSAAFAIVAASVLPGSKLMLRNVGMNPARDGIIRVLARMGANIEILNPRETGGEPVADLQVRGASLTGIDLPPDWVPACIDEIPVIMIAAAAASGVTRIRGARELRVKESDRLAVMAAGLQKLGVQVTEFDDGVDITGGVIYGGSVDAANDHRCAMSFLVAGQLAQEPVTVTGCEMIASSYPGFVEQMRLIGLQLSG